MLAKIEIKRTHLVTGALGLILILGVIQFAPGIFQEDNNYEDLNPEEFQQTIERPNAFTFDVHTPQSDIHIENTDAFIPYNELEENRNLLPEDKGTPIAVYCRSDNMSSQVAEELTAIGYENIYNLEGGTIAWGQQSLPFVEHTYSGAQIKTE